ncbi:MAG: hypothetical protein J7K21_05130 [Desulfurococcales archaeon]|nr:hypothetical protein [Desulfurococcales archaeon]
MPKKKRRLRKIKTLDQYFSLQPESVEDKDNSIETTLMEELNKAPITTQKQERETVVKPLQHIPVEEPIEEESEENFEEFIEEILTDLLKADSEVRESTFSKNNVVKEPTLQEISMKEATSNGLIVTEKPEEEKVEKHVLSSIALPSGEILRKLIEKPIELGSIISCNNQGECSDGIKISEIFVDNFGFRRQRGFVRTSRLPIILDWLIEEGVVKKVLPRAYKLETNRGALALVPEDFICELVKRYGVIIKNYDCSNYQVSLEGTSRRRKK